MARTAARVAVALVALASLALAGAAGVAASDPTLGARLTPFPIIYEQQPYLEVTNLSTIPVRVSLEFTAGDSRSWTLAEEAFSLGVNELRRVGLSATPDAQPVTISATLRALPNVAGAEGSVLALQTSARHTTALERLGASLGPYVPILALIVILGLLLTLYAVSRYGDANRPRRRTP